MASCISIKSIIIIPPISRNLSCFAISFAASVFTLNIVSSKLSLPTHFPELTSIAVNASVLSITIYPPHLSQTLLFSKSCNSFCIVYFSNTSFSSSTFTLLSKLYSFRKSFISLLTTSLLVIILFILLLAVPRIKDLIISLFSSIKHGKLLSFSNIFFCILFHLFSNLCISSQISSSVAEIQLVLIIAPNPLGICFSTISFSLCFWSSSSIFLEIVIKLVFGIKTICLPVNFILAVNLAPFCFIGFF